MNQITLDNLAVSQLYEIT